MDTEPTLRTAGPTIPGVRPRRDVLKVLRFLVVGGASAAIDLGTLVLLREVAGAPIPVAATVGFFTGLVFNFQLQRRWAFGATALRGPAARYAVLVVCNWVATLVIVTGGAALGVPYVVAKVVATGLVAIATYTAYDRWVFA